MTLATVYTRAPLSMHAPLVRVEVHLAGGLPAMTLVGLPEKAVKESKDRVRAAIINSGFEFPSKHITINLAPAELPKDGARYDLAIALGILIASDQLPADDIAQYEFHGELALSGEHPQLLLRLGYAAPLPYAKRKPVEAVIREAS